MTDSERLIRIEQRLEALITAMHALVDTAEVQRDMLAELSAWLRQPSDNELPDLLRALVSSFHDLEGQIASLPGLIQQTIQSNRQSAQP